jgi:hypothetical protein
MNEQTPLIRWFSDLDRSDTATVGGKNSSLGEMIGKLKGAQPARRPRNPRRWSFRSKAALPSEGQSEPSRAHSIPCNPRFQRGRHTTAITPTCSIRSR